MREFSRQSSRIPAGGGLREIKILGTVSHHGVGTAEQERGIGVMFKTLSDDDRAALESLMAGELGAAYFSSSS